MKIGDVVVHKTLGSQPLVVTGMDEGGLVSARFAVLGSHGVEFFREEKFLPEELESPVESMDREAEIFKALNAKRDEINEESKARQETGKTIPISKLN